MHQWTLVSNQPHQEVQFSQDSQSFDQKIETSKGSIGFRWSTWNSGKSLGMKCLSVDTGVSQTVLVPQRGMGIWKTWVQGIEFGWHSPVAGPVHPSLVPIGDPSGIGWLEGFDELVARCGLLSNGAPEFDASGKVLYPVHGRIANLPASSLQVQVDPQGGTLDIIATVIESRFLVYSLSLESRLRFHAGSSTIELHDTVTNLRSTPGAMQLLYHINLGRGALESDSKIHAPLKRLAPRDARAAEGIDNWNLCRGPESGFSEQVYYAQPLCDPKGWTEAMLCNARESLGYSVHFDRSTLPVVNFWKNTAAIEDGYVLGIEPATGFPNTRSFEEHQGRLVHLQGGESLDFHLKLEPLVTKQQVANSIDRIAKLQTTPCQIDRQPVPGWSPAGQLS